jgi:hypothetical protein
MFGDPTYLLAYDLAFSFVIFLGWAGFSPSPGIGRDQAVRCLRWALLAGIVGVAHPALGFAARDTVGQVGLELPDDRELAAKHARVSRGVNACAIGSLAVMGVVVVLGL